MDNEFYIQLKSVLNESEIKINEPLSNHTTFKIGGSADYFVTPGSITEIASVISLCRSEKMPYYIIGNGSNLLVGDKGYRGVVIQIFRNLSYVYIEKEQEELTCHVIAGAGILLSQLAFQIAEHGLTGFEFASGIPGTLGGAVTMNAGAYGGEIKDCIQCATVLDEAGKVIKLEKEQLDLGYRMSVVQKRGLIVLEAEFVLERGNKLEIQSTMKELNGRRRDKQPLEYPSAGSTFKRPKGYFAGKLIMDSGLSGYRVGDIMVSSKHCGFVINVGNGSAADVRKLISDVDKKVFDKFGVHLEPEVRFLGEF